MLDLVVFTYCLNLESPVICVSCDRNIYSTCLSKSNHCNLVLTVFVGESSPLIRLHYDYEAIAILVLSCVLDQEYDYIFESLHGHNGNMSLRSQGVDLLVQIERTGRKRLPDIG